MSAIFVDGFFMFLTLKKSSLAALKRKILAINVFALLWFVLEFCVCGNSISFWSSVSLVVLCIPGVLCLWKFCVFGSSVSLEVLCLW